MPGYLDTQLFHGPAPVTLKNRRESSAILPRDSVQLIIPNPASRFLGWDVQMSAVVNGAPTSISVSSGYSVANSISVGASATFGIVKDFLSTSLSVNYDQSWTSTETQQFQASVPAGKYGAFVSNPWTNRASGNVFEGTIGSEGKIGRAHV